MANERLAPDTVAALTNLSGAVTDIDDDPDTPDASWLTAPGNNVNTDVRVTLPTPSGTPTVGAGLQEFRALVRQFDAGQSGTPQARLELWENGNLVRAGGDTNVTSASGQVIAFTWNASELGTGDGSLVECKVIGTKSGGSPTTRNAVEVGAVEWNAEVSAGSSSFVIAGAVAVAPAIGGTLGFTRNAVLAGAVTLGSSVTAALDFTANAALAGAVTVSPAVAAGLSFGRDFALGGAVSVTPAVGSALDFIRNSALAGDVTLGTTIAAASAFTLNAALTGAVTVAPGVTAGLSFGGDFVLSGAVTVTPSPGAGLEITRHPALTGAVSLAASPGAVLARNIHPALAGSLALGSAVAAALSHTAGDKSIAGALTLVIAPAASGLLYGGPGSVIGRSALTGTVERTNLAGIFPPAELSGEVS